MKQLATLLFLLASFLNVNAQNGLEGVIVEKYYISNANDATMNGVGGVLPAGSVTYRIYVDLLPGYKFQAAYGIPNHELRLATTTSFFNNEDRGDITPAYSKSQASQNTVMLDSWLSAGAACNGNFGILKTEDDNVANVINANGILQNSDPAAGIPLTSRDGLIAGSPETVTLVGLDIDAEVFNDISQAGNLFSTYNGSWASLNGSVGPTTANKILIAQITTDGVFSFKLNIQIGTPTGNVQQYVAENPTGSEIQIPSLIYTSQVNTTISLKAFIEGFYTGGGFMNASIDPVAFPNLSDTIKLSFASSFAPFSIEFTTSAILGTNGIVQFDIPNSFVGTTHYLVLKHRNALETWSAAPVLVSAGFFYDFSDAQTRAFGNNLISLGDGSFALFSGDISDANLGLTGFQDGIMESQDYTDMENAVSVLAIGYLPQDITGDGVVESADYTIIENNVSALVFVNRP